MVKVARLAGMAVLLAAAALMACPHPARADSIGQPKYIYKKSLYSVPEPPTPQDERLSERVEEALKVWTKEHYPGQGRLANKAIVKGQDLYLVMSLWWKDMGFTSRLKKTEALWEFWTHFFKEEGPRYSDLLDDKDLKLFLIDHKGRPLGGSHTHGKVRAWVVQ